MNKNNGVNVISLFDGISCGQVALERAGINVVKYLASEIKKIGIDVTQKNWPNTHQIGDVLKVYYDKHTNKLYSNCERTLIAKLGDIILNENDMEWSEKEKSNLFAQGYKVLKHNEVIKYQWTVKEKQNFEKNGYEIAPSGEVFEWSLENAIVEHDANIDGCIDLLIGGSPCQDFSVAGAFSGKNQKGEYGLDGLKSRLFYEYLRIKKEIENARKKDDLSLVFFLENVHMKEESEKELNQYMGVKGIHINSRLLSFQNRPRIYWTNIFEVSGKPYVEPQDLNYNFQDFKEMPSHGKDACKRIAEALLADTPSRHVMWDDGKNSHNFACKNITNEKKVSCLTRKQDRCPNSGLVAIDANLVKEYFVNSKERMNCRFITKREVELAQTLEPGYLDDLSYTQAQDVAGDGWTVDVIAYFFKFLPNSFQENFKLPQGKRPWNLANYKIK